MIYTLANRPIEGFPVVHYCPNSVWGGSKPGGVKEIGMGMFLCWVYMWYERVYENPRSIICFEAELIDSPEDNPSRRRLDRVLDATLMYDYPDLKIGVFDQSGKIGFKKFHPASQKYMLAMRDFDLVAPIGNTYFGPFYLNANRLRKIEKMGRKWFKQVVEGRRDVVAVGGYDQYIMSVNHTTIGAYKSDDEITIDMQREYYIGDDAWRILLTSGDCLVWTHHQQKEMLPEAEEIMREVQEIRV